MSGLKVLFVCTTVAVIMLQGTASAGLIFHPECPKDKPYVFCLFDPCFYTECPRYPDAICVSDYCGGCNARFYVGDTEVTDHCCRDFCVGQDGNRTKCDGLCGVDIFERPFCNPSCDFNNGGCSEDQVCYPGPQVCSTFHCQDTVQCRHRPTICSQEPDSGPCEGYFRSFYYDVTTQRCQRFVYGGCGGNSNRFSSRKDCRRTCSGVTEHYNPCERFECIHGSRCKVNEITGEPFCEQSCEYDNGGCTEGQICRMTTLICLNPPCADVIECVENPCNLIDCEPNNICRVNERTGEGECVPDVCALVLCGGNSRCRVNERGEPECVGQDPTPNPPENPCNLIDCERNKVCRVNERTGEGECVPNVCALVLCGGNSRCRVNERGEPECVDETDPCSTVKCEVGTVCDVDIDSQIPKCKDICLFTKCAGGEVCQFNHDSGHPECITESQPPPLNACSYLLCQPGLTCRLNEEGGAECVFELH